MKYRAIVAGTGFEGRDGRIRSHAKPGMPVYLVPEPDNKHDPNAISVYIRVRGLSTLFISSDMHIGYVKRDKAAFLTKKMQDGGKILSAHIHSMDTYDKHPRVSLEIETDW